ncbi:hypothetical protein NSTC731_02397 [Nostoc sp. DSM 114167]|jgi:hypothetical protein
MNRGLLLGCLRKLRWKSSNTMFPKLPIIKEPHPQPLPAFREGGQSVALAGWGSWGLVSNQPDIIKYEIACKQDEKLLSAYDILLHLKRGV